MPTSARDLSIAEYIYELPDHRIARHPTTSRDGAKQLVYDSQTDQLKTEQFQTLARRLPTDTLLIGNRTRVIHARLFFPLAEGKRPIEIFCLDPLTPADHAQNLGARSQVQWQCLIGGNRRWKRGTLELAFEVEGHPVRLKAARMGRQGATFTVAFDWQDGGRGLAFGEILEAAGTLPLPPYLGRATERADEDRYQTLFATEEGSVAAPTAGLHFSTGVMQELTAAGVEWQTVTLHVGAGTFRPVSAPTLAGHDMHQETFSVSKTLIDTLVECYQTGRKVVSVGTTTLRCLESAHVIGAELALGHRKAINGPVHIGQWAFEQPDIRKLPPLESLRTLQRSMEDGGIATLNGATEVLLSPASGIRTVDGLITNFHQPGSTLLVLIAAIVGQNWRKIYQYALENDYRFLSYGDSSLLWR